MLGGWRWLGPTVLLVLVIGAFMALDRTTLHWYVPESAGSTVSRDDRTPAGSTSVASTPTATPAPRFAPFEIQALALQYVTQYFQVPGGYDCATPELNPAGSRWTSVCTERQPHGPESVVVIAVDAVTGFAADLRSFAQYADNTATAIANVTATAAANTATATSTKTPR